MTYIKIATASFTAQSSVSINSCFSSTYRHYLVTRNLLGSAADNALLVRLRASGADDSGANYRRQAIYAGSTSVSGDRTTGATSWNQALGYTEATAFGYALLRLSNPFEAVRTTAWNDHSLDADGSIQMQRLVYAHDSASSFDGITVLTGAGTITGSITVYGMKES